jgi:hypothetical protein
MIPSPEENSPKKKKDRYGLLKVGSLACRLEQQISRFESARDPAVVWNSRPRISLQGVLGWTRLKTENLPFAPCF